MGAERLLRKGHRIGSALFLLTIPLAAFASFTGDPEAPSPLVYLPLVPLFFLTISGAYMLVAPWVRRAKARRAQAPRAEA